MSLWQSFLVALGVLKIHKLRAFLTMLGVIIGVMSVSLIIMVSNGFQYYLTNEITKLGADTILVFYSPGSRDRGDSTGAIEGITAEHIQFLKDRVQSLDVISPIVIIPPQTATHADKQLTNPRLFAIDENFPVLNRLTLKSGRHLELADMKDRQNVTVIGEETAETLFGQEDPLGKSLNMRGITLEVVGVYKKLQLGGETNARDILVPLTTAQDKWIGGKYLNFLSTRPKPGYSVDQTMDELWQALMVISNNQRIFRVDSRQSIMNSLNSVLGVAGIVLAAIAALSLLVGGIGIMNIMLVSVTERTREIGLRKSVGAKSRTVLSQFLVESATLALVGGVIGMLTAWLIGLGVSTGTAAANWPSEGGLVTPFPLMSALIAAGFSAGIGMVFGLYPALRASKLSPIEALRAE